MIINHNITRVNPHRNLWDNTIKMSKTTGKTASDSGLDLKSDSIDVDYDPTPAQPSAESLISDAGAAVEMMELTRLNLLSQSASAILSHPNLQPEHVLKLLGN